MMKDLLPLLFVSCLFAVNKTAISQSTNINGPAGSGQFGSKVTLLTNGNYVVADPSYDDGAITDAGAVYLYNGNTHVLISTLKGSAAYNSVGSNGVIELSNGNFVVISSLWDNGPAVNAGAVTWGNGTAGVSGLVSSSNSLVGNKTGDNIGSNGITILTNGNYLVKSEFWDNGTTINAGAVSFGNGTTGLTDVVSGLNSLVGSTANDNVGKHGVTVLSNSNYVVINHLWDNGAATDAGAVSFGNGTTGITGVISSSNSLVGGTAHDLIGGRGVTSLSNGNYVVCSPYWDDASTLDAGAVSFGSGTTGVRGMVSSINSLVGGTSNNSVGDGGVTALTNSNYVVISSYWDNAAATDAGAVTFGSGTSGIIGQLNSSNSLVGSKLNDVVGRGGVTALINGNYVVSSWGWDNGTAADAGAVTFGDGTTGRSGVVSSSNSLVGSPGVSSDMVGYFGITALSNGNYVVNSPYWNNGAVTDAGAVTFGSGTTGITGLVNSTNSLAGSTATNQVGNGGVTALSNGNYIVCSPLWDNGASTNAGAVTFGNGASGVSGVVTSINSLVGSTINNNVGSGGITVLINSNYVVRSHNWDNGAVTNVGAVSFGNGATGLTGVVSSINSLTGSMANDNVGSHGIIGLTNGNYVVRSANWANSAATSAGAVSFGNGTTGVSGVVSSINSLVGSTANDLVGDGGVIALNNGNYIVDSYLWDNGSATDAGAVSFGSGTTGVSGLVSSSNSLVGLNTNDAVGNFGVTALSNGNYVVKSLMWANGAVYQAGAVTWGNGSSGTSGTINSCNSILGTAAGGGSGMIFTYSATNDYLLVGRPLENIITIYNASGMSIANTLDATTVNMIGTTAVPLIANTGCRIIAKLAPNGASQVNGAVNAKAWVEAGVPTHSGRPFVARHYEITPASNASTATAKVTLYFSQQEFTDFNVHAASALDLPTGPSDAGGKANLKIGKYAGISNNGSGLPATYTGAAEVIDPNDADIIWNNSLSRWEVSFNVTGFSGFIVQTFAFVLPLDLLEFSGRLQSNNGLLTWKTTNEINTHSFNVERSTDGRNYSAIGNVAAFNIAGEHQYNFTDNHITSLAVPVVYYRLKQKDVDGRFNYSKIVALSIDDSKSIVMFYPNPVSTEASLTITINKLQKVAARIVDNAGRVVKQMQWNLTAGSNALAVDVKGLAKGIYYLELKGETINERIQFVKQ